MIDFKVIGTPILLRNIKKIDPESIEAYIETGGYEALKKALKKSPDELLEEVKKSELRGRGGAGFPTGIKFEIAKNQKETPKFVVVNAEEGEPGTFKDRIILENDPHLVIEGAILAAYIIGANYGYIAIRPDYTLAIKRLEKAIQDAYKYGFLGDNILGSNFSFHLKIKRGAGAYICGEETALLEMIEGKRGEPRKKPPFPPQKGLYGKPTVVNNVETLANLPFIIYYGSEEFKKYGVEGSYGTKLFCMSGDVSWKGIIEIPFGVKLSEIISLAGGVKGGKLKAVILGGVSGSLVKYDEVDIEVDYHSLGRIQAGPGCGTIIVLNDKRDIVDVCENIMRFFKDESCGKCFPCRLGTEASYRIIKKIKEKKANLHDLFNLERICKTMKNASFCGLGQTAPNIILQSLQKFKDEWLSHIS